MASKNIVKYRERFDFTKISKELYQWFSGHMAKGLKKMYTYRTAGDCELSRA
jgi:hypothetical protein